MSTVPESTPRPEQFESSPRRDLLDALTDAEAIIVDAQHGIGTRRNRESVADAALLALAVARALVAVLLTREWLVQLDALRAGAPLAAVAAACGLDVDEVPAALRARIGEETDRGSLSRSTAGELLALLDRVAVAEPPPLPA